MAVLLLESTNPKFSYVIQKNPTSGIQVKRQGYGHSFGFYPQKNEQQYLVYFKDSPDTVSFKSYKDESIDFMNVSRYNSAVFFPAAIADYFSGVYKKTLEGDTQGFRNVFKTPLVRIDSPRYIEMLPKYTPGFEIKAKEIFSKSYELEISTERSVSDLLNFTAVFFVLNILHNKHDYFEGNEDQLVKYIASLSRLDAPYFVRYIFKVNLVRSEKKFIIHKSELEACDGYDIDMVFGSTAQQRLNAVKNRISFHHSIVEIGCGEGSMTAALAKKVDLPYYAIDPNDLCREDVTRMAKRKQLDHVTVLDSWLAYKEEAPATDHTKDLVCAEVVEHMPYEDAVAFLKDILDYGCDPKNKVNSLILTTPNYEFNQFYGIESFRHDDHYFELTETTWPELLATISKNRKIRTEAFSIGDTVNGHPTTFGAQIFFGE